MSKASAEFQDGVMAITGGGSGVGEGLARYGASLGMKVAIGDIDIGAAQAVADDLVKAGCEATAVYTDVRDANPSTPSTRRPTTGSAQSRWRSITRVSSSSATCGRCR